MAARAGLRIAAAVRSQHGPIPPTIASLGLSIGIFAPSDPRFFPESKPSFWRSLKYSTQRVVITRNDSGRDVFNTSGLLGPLASEGLANVYLPSSEQTVGKTLTRFATDLAWRVGGNMFKNYWPTFFRNMGLNRLKVIPDPGKSPGLEQAKPTDH
jgi:hypothetical protein